MDLSIADLSIILLNDGELITLSLIGSFLFSKLDIVLSIRYL
jgi:hypothetical protein